MLSEFNDLPEEDSEKNLDAIYQLPKRYSILNFLGCLVATLLIVLIIVYATIKMLIGPVIKKVDQLPNDFPQELTLYQPQIAEIKIQPLESKQKIVDLIKIMPDWLAQPILGYVSNNLKSRLVENFGDKVNVNKGFSAQEIKELLSAAELTKMETVSLKWNDLDRTKESVAAFYKQKLAENNFEFKENLADYQINLGFWKNDIFGLMSFKDAKGAEDSQAEIIVNYLKK